LNGLQAAFGIADVRLALVERAQTTMRQIVGARTLQNVITEREAVALEIEVSPCRLLGLAMAQSSAGNPRDGVRSVGHTL
jgi:hypothetical protein